MIHARIEDKTDSSLRKIAKKEDRSLSSLISHFLRLAVEKYGRKYDA